MIRAERMEVARKAIVEFGQAEVARRIGRSSSALSQVINHKYAGDQGTILELIEAEFSETIVNCQKSF